METLGEPALAFLPFPTNDGANFCWNGRDRNSFIDESPTHADVAHAISSSRRYDESSDVLLSLHGGCSAFCQAPPDNCGAYDVRSPPYRVYQDMHGCDASPVMKSLTHDLGSTCGGISELDLLTNNEMPCVCPPPSMITPMEAPSTYDVLEFSYPNHPCHKMRGGPLSLSQSLLQSSVVDYVHHKESGSSKRLKNNNLPLRSSSPVFPEKSTPLKNVGLLNGENYSNASFKFAGTNIDSAMQNQPNVRNPNVTSLSSALSTNLGSSEFTLTSTKSLSDSTPTKHFVELEMPGEYAKRISELDKKILKLHAERSILLEKALQTMECRTSLASYDHYGNSFQWEDKTTELGAAKIYICSVGIKELDEPLYDVGNRLLRKLGGLHFDLQSATDVLKNICFKNSCFLSDIAECFSHIKGLLSEGQTLSLSNSEGIYTIKLEHEGSSTESARDLRVKEALEATNRVLHCAQFITLSHSGVLADLGMAKEVARDKVAILDKIFLQNGLADREKPTVFTILEGNYAAVASAERVWSQCYQAASETICMLTETLHPSQSP